MDKRLNHYAVISDIHSNLEAFTAVKSDIEKREIPYIFCLGDLVGYGPNPIEIIKFSSEFEFTILGNHDEGTFNSKILSKFNPAAQDAIKWTKKIIDPGIKKIFGAKNYIKTLQMLSKKVVVDNILFSHGSPKSNMEYVTNESIASEIFELDIMKDIKICFVGHVHIPAIFEKRDDVKFIKVPGNFKYTVNNDVPVIIDIGSVGQARDGDWRASYVEVKDNIIQYHRIEYDVETTMKKIYKNKYLNNSLADRLYKDN